MMESAYEIVFNHKIDALKDHPKYKQLRTSANDALRYHTGYGLDAIHSADFMDRIICFPLDYILGWLNGENRLMWQDIYPGKSYDSLREIVIDRTNEQYKEIKEDK